MSLGLPAISVVVTNYNYRDYVVEAIESAFRQTRPPSEVIVVDDGSTDGSGSLLTDRFGQDTRAKIVTGENAGQLAAFRRGFSLTSGDVVAFLDADDIWDEDYLVTLASVYEQNPTVDFVVGNLRFMGAQSGTVKKSTIDKDLGIGSLAACWAFEFQGAPTSAISIRRELLSRIFELPPKFDRDWRICADVCVSIGANLLGGHTYALGTPYGHYRVHTRNNYANKTRSRIVQYRNMLRELSTFKFYVEMAGLGEYSLRHAHAEFKTKPRPGWKDLWLYVSLTVRARVGIGFKLWSLASMVKHMMLAHRRIV